MKRIRIHVADNHDLILEGIKSLIAFSNIEVVGYSENGLKLIEWDKKNDCDIIVLDISMSKMNGIEVLKYFKQNNIKRKIVVFSSYLDFKFIEETIKLGAKSYVLKDEEPESLVNAINYVYNGRNYFSDKVKKYLASEHILSKGEKGNIKLLTDLMTEKELSIIKLLVNDHSNIEIGKKMDISPSTVRSVTYKLKNRFNTSTTVGLALRFAFLQEIND